MMKIHFTKWLFILISFQIHAQTTRFVTSSGAGTQDGTSWSNASDDLQNMIDIAEAGDSIFVAGGAYQPASGQAYAMKEGVKIFGHFAGTELHLSQRDLTSTDTSYLSANGYLVILNSSGITTAAVLDGFTIQNGNTNLDGAGMYNFEASPTINNCVFQNNHCNFGGAALYNNQCTPVINHCLFRNNTAHDGGAVFNLGALPLFNNCLFYNNTAVYGGGAINNHTSFPVITNCTFTQNDAALGSAINNYVPPNAPDVQPTKIYNTVVWNNTGFSIYNDGAQAMTDIKYSNTQTTEPGEGNMSVDPQFINPGGSDFRLPNNSPLINAGSNALTALAGILVDLDHLPRKQSSAVEMGAYENQNAITRYVKPSATGTGDGKSWANASGSIRDMVNASVANGQVFVGGGLYLDQPEIEMKEGVKIYGHFAGTEIDLEERNLNGSDNSILKRTTAGVIINNNYIVNPPLTKSAVFDGFTFEGDNYIDVNAIKNITCGTPLFENCIIQNFYSNESDAAIIIITSNCEFKSCIFKNNLSNNLSGAIKIDHSSVEFTGCQFINNSGKKGGCIYSYFSNTTMTNCSFTNNHASSAGGVVFHNLNSSCKCNFSY